MQLFSLLADIDITVFGQTYDITLSWLGRVIRWLIEGVGSVGLGVILFSVILRLIVLPFDVVQRVNMRKQNAKMEQNKEKMDKLQKQYANNKDMYNKKVMEMQKKEGLGMLSSCLPMILSLVIFIVAINNFTEYSQYANVQNYNEMVNAYNAQLSSYAAEVTTENFYPETDGENAYIVVKDDLGADKYLYFKVNQPENYDTLTAEEKVSAISAVSNNDRKYFIDVEKVWNNAELSALVAEYLPEEKDSVTATDEERAQAAKDYFMSKAQDAVVTVYETKIEPEKTSFAWIKNVWETDASYKHPILEYEEFKTTISQKSGCGSCNGETNGIMEHETNAYAEGTYNIVTGKLTEQKEEANGYYILIVLSIGTILLQQWHSNRSQKAQQKYSSVDGQGAMTQKTTMIMMTVMFAFFAFMYSAAFSMYMITGNILSLLTTIVINKCVDVSLHKKAQKEEQAKYDQRFYNRRNSKKDEKKKK